MRCAFPSTWTHEQWSMRHQNYMVIKIPETYTVNWRQIQLILLISNGRIQVFPTPHLHSISLQSNARTPKDIQEHIERWSQYVSIPRDQLSREFWFPLAPLAVLQEIKDTASSGIFTSAQGIIWLQDILACSNRSLDQNYNLHQHTVDVQMPRITAKSL